MAMQFESEEEALVWEAHQRSGLNGKGLSRAFQELQQNSTTPRCVTGPSVIKQQRAIPQGSSAADDLEELKTTAEEIVANQTIASRDRLVHLRSIADDLDTRFTDGELR